MIKVVFLKAKLKFSTTLYCDTNMIKKYTYNIGFLSLEHCNLSGTIFVFFLSQLATRSTNKNIRHRHIINFKIE